MAIHSSASTFADRHIGARRQIDIHTPDADAAVSRLRHPVADLAAAHSPFPVVMDLGIPLPE